MKEDEQYIQKYSVIVKAGNMSRGYVVYAGSAFDMMKKLMEHVTLYSCAEIIYSEILLDKDVIE